MRLFVEAMTPARYVVLQRRSKRGEQGFGLILRVCGKLVKTIAESSSMQQLLSLSRLKARSF
jgi:hypothetical protein